MAASKENFSGGYVVDVINKSDKKKFDCMLCLSIVKKATHGCMNHVFCFDCLQKYIESNDRKEIQYCPAGCQQTFNINELSSNNPYNQLINQIDCKCSFCCWEGELLDFVEVHDGKCEEKLIPCHLCSIALKRKYMDHHLKNECTHRPVVCRGCEKNFPFVDHLKHEEICADIKIQCSFTNFGCNFEETRRNMTFHENDSCQQHLSLIAKYFTNENKLLKEENKQLKEETKQFKEENKEFKEENKQIKEKMELLEMNIRVLTWKDNFTQILLKEPAKKFFYFPAVDEMHIKNNYLLSPNVLFNCCSKNDFTWIIECLANECDVLNNYNHELKKLISSTKTIMFSCHVFEFYFFQIDYFKFYKNGDFSLKKDGNIFYINNYNNRYMRVFISKWEIKIEKSMMEIDVTDPDERFKVSAWPHPSSKYFCIWY